MYDLPPSALTEVSVPASAPPIGPSLSIGSETETNFHVVPLVCASRRVWFSHAICSTRRYVRCGLSGGGAVSSAAGLSVFRRISVYEWESVLTKRTFRPQRTAE